jgi:aquaporin Z
VETSTFSKFSAEFLGTLVLVLMGCGSAVIAGANGTSGIGLLGISFAFGLSVVAMAYAIGHISGCHINPAISIGMVVAGRMKAGEAAVYIGAQAKID